MAGEKMFEGLFTMVASKLMDLSIGKHLSRRKTDSEDTSAESAKSKVMQDAGLGGSESSKEKAHVDLEKRQALHERITWFCDPLRAEQARSLQEFARQCSETYVRFVILLESEPERTEYLERLLTETVGATLDAFSTALPYLFGDTRMRFGHFIDAAAVAAKAIQVRAPETPRKEAIEQLVQTYESLLPELTAQVDPFAVYGAMADAAQRAGVDEASTDGQGGEKAEE